MVRHGNLEIAPEIIGELLRLPEGNRVVAARVSFFNRIELLVEGPLMPESEPQSIAPRVSILCSSEIIGGMRRITGSFVHAPDEPWVIGEHPWPEDHLPTPQSTSKHRHKLSTARAS